MPTLSEQLSDRIYTQIESKFGKLPKAAREPFKKFVVCVAEGLLLFLDQDATIEVTVTTSIPGGTGPTGQPLPGSTVSSSGTGKLIQKQ